MAFLIEMIVKQEVDHGDAMQTSHWSKAYALSDETLRRSRVQYCIYYFYFKHLILTHTYKTKLQPTSILRTLVRSYASRFIRLWGWM